MAIGATYIPDAYGQYKQLFYDTDTHYRIIPNLRTISNTLIYGLLPFLYQNVSSTQGALHDPAGRTKRFPRAKLPHDRSPLRHTGHSILAHHLYD
jgi:hypothetical protein